MPRPLPSRSGSEGMLRVGIVCSLLLLPLVSSVPIQAREPASIPAACDGLERDGREIAECVFEEAPAATRAVVLRNLLTADADRPWVLFYLGHALFGCDGGSEEAYQQAVERFATRNESEHVVNVTTSLVWNMARCDRSIETIESRLEDAAHQAEALPDPVLPLLKIELVRGRLRSRRGGDLEADYARLRQLEAQLFAPRYDGDDRATDARLESLRALGGLAFSLGRYREARVWFARLERVAGDLGRDEVVTSARFDLRLTRAAFLIDKQPRPYVLTELRQLLVDARATNHRGIEAKTHYLLAAMEEDEGLAREHLERCLGLATAARDPRQERRCRLRLARRMAVEEPERARELLDDVHRLEARLDHDLMVRVESWRDRFPALWAVLEPAEAWAESATVLDAIEQLRWRQSGMARPDIVHARSDAYYWLAERLLALDDHDRAFAVLERLRAQDLRQSLEARVEPEPVTSLDMTSLDMTSADELPRVLESQLGNREAMVAFQIGPRLGDASTGCRVWISTRQGTWSLPLAIDRYTLERQVDMLIDQDQSEWNVADLRLLGDVLLAPVLEALPTDIEQLIIIPDGILHLVPFALLDTRATGPLSSSHELTVAPSATLWLQWRERSEPTITRPALVIADPTLPDHWDVERTALPADWRDRPAPLPFARREGRRVVRLVGGGSRLVDGAKASEAFLRRADLSPYGLIHFAAHAVANVEQPELSGVLLAVGEPGDDGWLRPSEIARLELEGKIVVLSTCDSARGAWRRGEGVMSLARAFFQAGAHAVVATLGPLPDEKGERFFEDFYRYLSRGDSLRRALATTQRDWLARGEPSTVWGRIVVVGNGDLALRPGGRRPDLGWLVGPDLRWLVGPDLRWLVVGGGVLALLLGVGGYAWLSARRAPPSRARSRRYRPDADD
ncbi:MAG: CHAT domain-containing protein [Acidobacteriota bacterium]